MATFIAGPCVIESMELLDTVAQELVRINQKLGTDIIFKASLTRQTEPASTLSVVLVWKRVYRCSAISSQSMDFASPQIFMKVIRLRL